MYSLKWWRKQWRVSWVRGSTCRSVWGRKQPTCLRHLCGAQPGSAQERRVHERKRPRLVRQHRICVRR